MIKTEAIALQNFTFSLAHDRSMHVLERELIPFLEDNKILTHLTLLNISWDNLEESQINQWITVLVSCSKLIKLTLKIS